MLLYPATADDTFEAHALIERAYRGDSARQGWTHEADLLSGQRTDEALLAAMIASPDEHLLINRDGDAIIGCIAVKKQPDGLAYIGMVTIEPILQRHGLGRIMLEAAEAFAVGSFCAESAEMTVIAQREELIAWYERRGYRQTGEKRPFPLTDRRFGEPKRQDLEFVVLEKALRSQAPEA